MDIQKTACGDGGGVKAILNKTCKRRMILWHTDADGQIGGDEEEGKATEKMPYAT